MALVKKPVKPSPEATSQKIAPPAAAVIDDRILREFESRAPDGGKAANLAGKGIQKGSQVQFSLQIKAEVMDRLNEYVRTNDLGLSRNQVVGAAIKAWLDGHELG